MADNTSSTPAFPADEVHGDGIQQIRRHLGLTQRQYTAVEMAKGVIAAHGSDELSFDEVSDRAIAQADSLLAKLSQVQS